MIKLKGHAAQQRRLYGLQCLLLLLCLLSGTAVCTAVEQPLRHSRPTKRPSASTVKAASSSSSKRFTVTLGFSACGGLFNQHYSQISGFLFGLELGVDAILMPYGLRRSGWTENAQWFATPQNSVWDVTAIQDFAAGAGFQVLLVPVPDPPLLAAGSVKGQGYNPGYLSYLPPHIAPDHVLNMTHTNHMHHPPHDPAEFVAEAREALAAKVASLPRDSTSAAPVPILLRMACSLFSIHTVGSRSALAVAQHLAFAPQIHALADKVCKGMALAMGRRSKASPVFNGVHLRVEEDAMSWLTNFDAGVSETAIWDMYYERCQQSGFSPTLPLFVASGVLGHHSAAQQLPRQFQVLQERFGASLHHKEMYLSPEEVAGLNSEQLALIDFLVLARSQRCVGIATSTFSLFLVEYRAIHGVDRGMSALVDLRSMPQFYYDYLAVAASFSV